MVGSGRSRITGGAPLCRAGAIAPISSGRNSRPTASSNTGTDSAPSGSSAPCNSSSTPVASAPTGANSASAASRSPRPALRATRAITSGRTQSYEFPFASSSGLPSIPRFRLDLRRADTSKPATGGTSANSVSPCSVRLNRSASRSAACAKTCSGACDSITVSGSCGARRTPASTVDVISGRPRNCDSHADGFRIANRSRSSVRTRSSMFRSRSCSLLPFR